MITFTLELSTSGRDTQIAAAGGAVGLYEARELERAIVAGIGQGRTRVVVDLTDVTEVGPGLLGILLRLRRGVTRVGGAVALVSARPPISDLVETTLLAVLIPVPVTGPRRSPSSAGAASRPVIAGRREPSSAQPATSSPCAELERDEPAELGDCERRSPASATGAPDAL